MTSVYLKAEHEPLFKVQQMLQDDVVFVNQMVELESLRSALLEQKRFNSTLEEQLKRATKIQLKLEKALTEMEQQLQQHFNKVSEIHKQMYSKNLEIGLIAANNTTATDDVPRDVDIQEFSLDNEEKHELRPYLRLPSENGMQVESSSSLQKEQVPLDLRRKIILTVDGTMVPAPKPPSGLLSKIKHGSSKSNAVESDARIIEIQQGDQNQENDVKDSNADVAVENHQTEEVVPQPRTANPVDYSERSRSGGVLRLKRCQVLLNREISDASPKNIRDGRKRKSVTKVDCCPNFEELKTYSCTECDKSFIYKCHFVAHSRIHTGERPFQCRKCGAAFAYKGLLTTHQKIHSRVKPFKCSICDAAFRQKGNLATHQRIHSGERPFPCLICDASFRQKSNLSQHLLIHINEKPFMCDICQRSFREKITFSDHMAIHSGSFIDSENCDSEINRNPLIPAS